MINITTLNYENVTEITTNPVFLGMIIAVWLIPLLIYVIIGSVAKAKSPSGQTLSKPMIAYPNFWYAFFIWFLLQSALILILLIFPIWLKLMG